MPRIPRRVYRTEPVSIDVQWSPPANRKLALRDEGTASALRLFYQQGEFTDVTIICAGETFRAHQLVLAAGSEVFRKGLARSPGAAPTNQEIRMADVSHPDAMRLMLAHMYGIDAQVETDYDPGTKEINNDVLYLSQLFKLPELESRATYWLSMGITTDNVVERLQTCDDFKLHLLHKKILERLTRNKEAFAQVANGPEVGNHPNIMQAMFQQLRADEQGTPDSYNNSSPPRHRIRGKSPNMRHLVSSDGTDSHNCSLPPRHRIRGKSPNPRRRVSSDRTGRHIRCVAEQSDVSGAAIGKATTSDVVANSTLSGTSHSCCIAEKSDDSSAAFGKDIALDKTPKEIYELSDTLPHYKKRGRPCKPLGEFADSSKRKRANLCREPSPKEAAQHEQFVQEEAHWTSLGSGVTDLTVEALHKTDWQRLCKERGLSSKGAKADLAARFLAADLCKGHVLSPLGATNKFGHSGA